MFLERPQQGSLSPSPAASITPAVVVTTQPQLMAPLSKLMEQVSIAGLTLGMTRNQVEKLGKLKSPLADVDSSLRAELREMYAHEYEFFAYSGEQAYVKFSKGLVAKISGSRLRRGDLLLTTKDRPERVFKTLGPPSQVLDYDNQSWCGNCKRAGQICYYRDLQLSVESCWTLAGSGWVFRLGPLSDLKGCKVKILDKPDLSTFRRSRGWQSTLRP
jgi:hypothetical protein